MGEKMRKNIKAMNKISTNTSSTRISTKNSLEVEAGQEVEEEEAQIEEIEDQEDTTPEEDGGGSETTARRKTKRRE